MYFIKFYQPYISFISVINYFISSIDNFDWKWVLRAQEVLYAVHSLQKFRSMKSPHTNSKKLNNKRQCQMHLHLLYARTARWATNKPSASPSVHPWKTWSVSRIRCRLLSPLAKSIKPRTTKMPIPSASNRLSVNSRCQQFNCRSNRRNTRSRLKVLPNCCILTCRRLTQKIYMNWGSFIKIKAKNFEEDYCVVQELGRGAFGTVSKVMLRSTKLMRAMKSIKKSSLIK